MAYKIVVSGTLTVVEGTEDFTIEQIDAWLQENNVSIPLDEESEEFASWTHPDKTKYIKINLDDEGNHVPLDEE
jgi:hypothetical protein